MRRLVLASVVVAFTFAFAYSDENAGVRIVKIDGNKVTWGKGTFDAAEKKFTFKAEDLTTSTVKDGATIEKAGKAAGKGKKGAKADPEAIADGLKNDLFKDVSEAKSVGATITTDGAGKAGVITKITTGGKGGGKKKDA